jgi:glycosyltransferase involved in cell wall biosynthesis
VNALTITKELLLISPPARNCSHSMKIYANQVLEAAETWYDTEVYRWPQNRLDERLLGSRFNKYISSPVKVRKYCRPKIQHITDQSYAHLFNKNAERNILTVHDINPIVCHREPFDRSFNKPPLLFYYVSRYFSNFDHIITPTMTTKNYLIDIFGLYEDNITVINNPVTVDDCTKTTRKLDGINVLIIGSSLYKNCKASFEAVNKFSGENCCDVVVHWIISDPPSKEMTNFFNDSGGKVLLNVYSNLERSKVLNLYSVCSLLLFPSLIEGFGYPIVEAFKSKLPVITSNYGAMSEVARGHCYLIDPTSVREIVDALNGIIFGNSTVHNKMVNAAYDYSLIFNNDRFSQNLLDVYNRVGLWCE